MKQILNKTPWEIEEEITYESAIRPYKDHIRVLAEKIMKDFEEAKVNEWARLETLEKVKIRIVDSLGTIVDPGE